MNNATLFALCCLIWGSTWIAITYQIGYTSETFAIALRYLLASACLGIYCVIRRLPLKLPVHVHVKMAAVGLFLYSLNYTLLYMAQAHIISALLALMSSCIIYINVVLRRWWLKEPIRKEVVIGATFGLLGIVCLFVPEFSKVSMDAALATGLAIAFVSFFCASTVASQGGNMPFSRKMFAAERVQLCRTLAAAVDKRLFASRSASEPSAERAFQHSAS